MFRHTTRGESKYSCSNDNGERFIKFAKDKRYMRGSRHESHQMEDT